MEFELTPGAQRAILEATWWSSRPDCPELEAPALLLGLLAESECRAALFLAEQKIDSAAVCRQWPGMARLAFPLPAGVNEHRFSDGDTVHALPKLSEDLSSSFLALISRLGEVVRWGPLSTEHLLLALASAEHELSAWLRQRGIDADVIEEDLCRHFGIRREPVPLEDEPLEFDEAERGGGSGSSSALGQSSGKAFQNAQPFASAPRPGARKGGCVIQETEGIADKIGVSKAEKESNREEGFTGEEGQQAAALRHDYPATGGRITNRTHGSSAPEGPIANRISMGRTYKEGTGEGQVSRRMGILRVIDASANRAREGLRVVEDYVRFVLDDRHLTGQLKRLRHDLTGALAHLQAGDLLAARETQADVGTRISTPSERSREDATGVVTANFVRAQESLRSLEEFGKTIDPDMAAKLEEMRYRAYTLQRAVEITASSLERLAHARLYVIIDGKESVQEFAALVESLVHCGVPLVQLRDKRLEDRELLDRARLLRKLTAGSGTLFIMNDRPDLAALSQADGVHVGQTELTVKDARAIVGPEALVGVSTHSIPQARQAVLDGANYIGVGPTFPSETKQFDAFPGLELLRAVAAEIRLPAFAIGGICCDNLPEVLRVGFRRIAVSGAVASAADPAAAARELLVSLGRPV